MADKVMGFSVLPRGANRANEATAEMLVGLGHSIDDVRWLFRHGIGQREVNKVVRRLEKELIDMKGRKR